MNGQAKRATTVRRSWRHGWGPPIVVIGVLVIVLLLILIPGVRVFPESAAEPRAVGPAIDPETSDQLLRALEHQRDALLARLDQGVCRPLGVGGGPRIGMGDVGGGAGAPGGGGQGGDDGLGEGADGADSAGGVGESEGGDGNASDAGDGDGSEGGDSDGFEGGDSDGNARPSAEGMINPGVSPEDLPVPGTEGRGTLADLIARATVLILTPNGLGSGFFLSDTQVATNRHVIEDSSDGQVIIAGQGLESVIRGRVVAQTETSTAGDSDFALIALETPAPAAAILPFNQHARQLQTVFAGGYPGLALRSDPRLRRLVAGDPQSIPQAALTRGEVMALQPQANGVPLILHQAFITSGNSGGPLVDACGALVGINTFVANERDGAMGRINYALGSISLVRFLEGQGVTPATRDSPCQLDEQTARSPTASGGAGMAGTTAGRDGGGAEESDRQGNACRCTDDAGSGDGAASGRGASTAPDAGGG